MSGFGDWWSVILNVVYFWNKGWVISNKVALKIQNVQLDVGVGILVANFPKGSIYWLNI